MIPGISKAPLHGGIGFRQPHYRELLEQRPPLAFLEVHSENFFADGGAALAVLHEAREVYPISLHGVGLALGSAAGLDPWHLDRLARLVQRIEPRFVSDHACFARAPLADAGAIVHANDLLPIAFTPASLDLMVAHVTQVQERLRRPILVENLSAYVAWADDAIPEPEFFNQLARRSGCGLLLDLNNLVVNSLNVRTRPRNTAATLREGSNPPWGGPAADSEVVRTVCAHVDAIDAQAVQEIHLAGYHDDGQIVIDDHGSRVHDPVWQVYRHALQRLGPVPTLIEWDTDVPPLDVLLGEAAAAQALLQELAR